ncbi:MAG: M20/M25/M40 family metallo-hydrolase [Vicinamibacterales bacterium]
MPLKFGWAAALVVAATLGANAGRAQPAPGAAPAQGPVEHEMKIALDPATHRLVVSDKIALASRPPGGSVDFVLNAALRLVRAEPAATEVPVSAGGAFFGINSTANLGRQVKVKRYRVSLPPGATPEVTLAYEGEVDFGLSDEKEQYTRGFRETAGILGPEGVYLAGSGFWYPAFDQELLTFTLEVEQPAGWHVISQGNGTSRGADGRARWDSGGPMDEIYLVGGPLHPFRDSAGSVETSVYLHDANDEQLASKYLAATAQYLEMYRELIGPYPYGKFALVENFWETGYGMPTFTLLGREVIRFPFIITSSYPHEILHNWWGNSVFVDYQGGNWCEGLTAYLADHLIQEQRGAGAEYRQSTLQKYRDYVKEGRDFPLIEFRSRHSASTEAVGYGKALMAFHMLRLAIGDDGFRGTIARFYRDFKGRRASFADLERTVESVTGRDFSRFFADWVGRAGAPVLAVEATAVRREGGAGPGYIVEATLRQTQGGEPFAVDVPVVLQTAGGTVRQVVRLERNEVRLSIAAPGAPLALHVDPGFDVFRKLDPRETPPSIGQIFGEPHILAVLPSAAPRAELEAWRSLFEGWRSDSHAIETRLDTELQSVPSDRAVWIAGRSNKWAGRYFKSGGGMTVGPEAIEVDGERMALPGHSLVVTIRHPENAGKAIGWLAVEPAAAFPGFGRKLPHYGKYSYLGFEGTEPVNVLKGQWQQSDSPLSVDLRGLSSRAGASVPAITPPLPPDPRKALAELPPVFSEKAIMEHVSWLANPAREGRVPGSEGHEAAAKHIADRFKAAGLLPGGEGGSYFQSFTMQGPDGKPHIVANVVGYIQGTKTDWEGQSVVVSAHYDHLGRGWPDVHKGDEGKVHPGADDNASGVAVLLELARAIAAEGKPSRSIVFAAFTGEEAGLAGSRHYTRHAGRFPVDKVTGAINIDTVGRLGSGRLSVLGTATASEWQHIFRGASFVTGVESRNVPEPLQSSDQAAFIEKGVPAVQIFTTAHGDYHRPTDTVDKIDSAGLVKVATFVREGVAYLAERPEPLTNMISGAKAPPPAATGGAGVPKPAGGRRASLGTVPDFAFAGPGVRVSGVVPGSSAEKSGIEEGDVLVAIDGKPIADLQGYSDILRGLEPGQTVEATILRAGSEMKLKVTLGER